MFPSFIVGGLRVEIDLNSASKALGVWTAEEYDNLPARNADQSQLYKTYPTGGDATYSTTIDYTAEGVECVVAFRLYSGVLGQLSTKMFPSFIVGGLRVEIDLKAPPPASLVI